MVGCVLENYLLILLDKNFYNNRCIMVKDIKMFCYFLLVNVYLQYIDCLILYFIVLVWYSVFLLFFVFVSVV